MAYTFNGVTKRITLSSGMVTLDLLDLHSRWKDWLLLGNAGYEQAFRAVGGDIPAIPLYLFLLNGWRVRPMEASHNLTITGNLFVDGGGVPVVSTLGTYQVNVNYTVPVQAQGIATSGSTGPTAGEIAAAILAAAQITPIYSDIRKVNNLAVDGTGTESDPWGPSA